MVRPVAFLAVFASLLFLAAGCGSSGSNSTSATDTWATSVCSSITTWQASIKSAVDSVTSNPSKSSVQSAAADGKSATETLVSDLKGLGKPDTAAGQEAKDSLDQLSTNLQSGVNTIESAITGVSGASGVASAISTVSGTLATMGTDATTTVTDLQGLKGDSKSELKDSFTQSSACDPLTSNGS